MSAKMQVGFLYNHEATHQVAHSAPVAAALAKMNPDWDIILFHTTAAAREEIARYCSSAANLRFQHLRLPPLTTAVARIIDRLLPMSRLQTLRAFAEDLRSLDALVVTELTSARLKSIWPQRRPKLITVSHGAGDRDVGFDPQFAEFDLVLQAGKKQINRFVEELGLLSPDQVKSIGYVKFDSFRFGEQERPVLFNNNHPTVLYNPHFSPDYSSWYEWGPTLLKQFSETPEMNFIVAPHVMLGKRRLHGSLKSSKMIWRSEFQRAYETYPNILLDMGSSASVDMTYTRAADIYLGDMSSQIYEFLLTPRPAIFLNPHDLPWMGNAEYRHWTTGEVISSVSAVSTALRDAHSRHEAFKGAQEALFAETFDLNETPSAARAAAEIRTCLTQ